MPLSKQKGRYRTGSQCRFWSQNKDGVCILPLCAAHHAKEDVPHILLSCPSLSPFRHQLSVLLLNYNQSHPYLSSILTSFFNSTDIMFKTQFLLDCSVLPQVVHLQQHGCQNVLQDLFYITRTWCFSLHRERLKLLQSWTGS